MTQDDIIRMARQAGFNHGVTDPVIYAAHERFADLIAAHEREECAKVCEKELIDPTEGEWSGCAEYLANNIRARGNK
jgi:hypothetical protein